MKNHRHVGVYALVRDAGRVLLIRKTRGPYNGSWDLPGGSPEFGEEPDATLLREVLEETGLGVTAARLARVLSITHAYTDHEGPATLHHIGILYEAMVGAGDARTSPDGEDAAESKWFPLADLPPLSPLAAAALTP